MFLCGFFTFFVPIETGMYALQWSYNIFNFALIVSAHYLIKLKHIKHILKLVVMVFYYSTARFSLWTNWPAILQVMLKMSAFYTDTHCQPTSSQCR